MRTLLVVMASVGVALAAPPTLQRNQIEALERDGRFVEAAEGYEALARVRPADPRVDELYYNAAVTWVRAGHASRATVAYGLLIQERPASLLAKRALFVLARIYQE